MTDATMWTIVGVAYLATWSLIPHVLLKRTTHTSGALAWIFTIVFVPFVGAMLFGIFGTNRWENRPRMQRSAKLAIDSRLPRDADAWIAGPHQLHDWQPIAQAARNSTGRPVMAGNTVQLYADTHRSIEAIESIIRSAQRWIHIEFYIWRHDEIGTKLRDLLIEKAQAGIQIRFLFDGIGSIQLSRHFLRPLRDAGVQVAPFTPGIRLWHILSLNLRNHRKLVVTDQQMAFTGGMNIGDEYLHPTEMYGRWRDTQLTLTGPAAAQFQQVFAQDWLYATGEELTDDAYFPTPRESGAVPTQVVADGPDDEVDTLYILAVAAIGQAKHRVTLTTPYFVPPDGLAVALSAAARRGVDVRMMVANRGNFLWTFQAGRSYYDRLLDCGVKIYEYNRGLFHPKTLTVDGQWSLVGTANWDFRSLFLNFELAVALFDPQVAETLEAHFEQDKQFADEICSRQWRQRSRWRILHEQFWRIFAPTL
ncbi:MAG: cardiolipin synthase [Pirellulaceae bacterium]|nr:cardiolipin synthase [Planctomycetales bacterium]MCA9209995.1 cardiolipin synthase [Planctomycetales bacterium]